MHIKFNDLNKQFFAIKDPFYQRLKYLTETSQYILGQDVRLFEENFAKYIGCKYAIGVNSGTDAITLSAKALIKQNRRHSCLFITQANTFIATIYGILNSLQSQDIGINIIDCDQYGQMNIDQLYKSVQQNRNYINQIIIVPVHMYGGCVNAEAILEIANKYDCQILEDSAQAHGTISNINHKTGNIGNIGAFSLYPGKNLGAIGDAGIITTNDQELYDKIIKMRNIGSNQKYNHSYPAYNSRLDSFQAIVLDEKLKFLDSWNQKRIKIANQYQNILGDRGLQSPSYCKLHTYHLFPAFNINEDKLKKENIEYGKHYPIQTYQHIKNDNNINQDIIYYESNINQTKKFANSISLPIHPYMEDNEIEYVCSTISD